MPDPAPYEKEAAPILRGMNEYLWLPEGGEFCRIQRVARFAAGLHPILGRWTFYHTLDSAVDTLRRPGK